MTVSVRDWDPRHAAFVIHQRLFNNDASGTSERATISHWAQSSQPTLSIGSLFHALSVLLIDPRYTNDVIGQTRPIILQLFIQVFERLNEANADWTSPELQRCIYALATVLDACPELGDVVSLLLQRFSTGLEAASLSEHALQLVLLSFYRIANVAPILLDDAPSLLQAEYLLTIAHDRNNHVPATRILAIRLFARLEALTEKSMITLLHNAVGPPGIKDDPSGDWIDGRMQVSFATSPIEQLDAWTLPITERWRMRREIEEVPAARVGELLTLDHSCFSSRLRYFGHLLFLRRNAHGSVRSTTSTFKETASLMPAICSLAQLTRSGLPVLLSGPEACGKTSLISHACMTLDHDQSRSPIVWLQLGDQSGVDAKSLIGSFVSSTSRPGTFEWVEGALTRAVKLGKWVVLEDIDKANNEILSVIKPLTEGMAATTAINARPYLELGSRGRVQAKKGFALFATRSISKLQAGSSLPPATFFGNNHWHEVQMSALKGEDIFEIVKTTNPFLRQMDDESLRRFIACWHALVQISMSNRKSSTEAFSSEVSAGTLRIPSLHDLLKWCKRIDTLLKRASNTPSSSSVSFSSNQALQEDTALEAIDVFLGASPPPIAVRKASDRFAQMISVIADHLHVDSDVLWHAVRVRRPEMSVQNSMDGHKAITVGRCHGLRQYKATIGVARPSTTFALTGPAARLLERIAVCVAQNEPCLIVGETGTGKTTVVQQLAAFMRKPLVALNLSQQTESADLLGGFKPLDPKIPATDLHNVWLDLFEKTFSLRRNAQYLQAERKAMQSQKWARLVGTWRDSIRLAMSKLAIVVDQMTSDDESSADQPPRKTMRTHENVSRAASPAPSANGSPGMTDNADLLVRWKTFERQLSEFHAQHLASKRSLVFAFVEGPLVKAIRDGSWILLDEINLATAETLECLSTLLQSSSSSVVLTEKGDLEPVERHPDFHLFACMNPATDVGKKDLPNSLRSRFTELYAPSPDADTEALVSIIESYIKDESVGDRGVVLDVAQCFVEIKTMTREQRLADGANQRPHFSVRTLARALTFAKDTCPTYGIRRALYEGFCMAFTMLLDAQSSTIVRTLLYDGILAKAKNAKAAAKFVPARPNGSQREQYIQVGAFWLETGSETPEDVPEYILTPSVQDKLAGLARAALTRRSPVLIQGPTSAGKTSAVEYLAKRTGHRFVRINNHEHTDLQEYLGTYSTDPQTGKLAFQEGLLVTAARRGDWIVLDELNLAPTDVLEALNRLLDDNRELQLPQTGEVIKPHPHFMLFATQNPPGLYAGRKVLSRAFRNRFLEIHFDDVPQAELQTILANRCQIAPTYAGKIVQVFLELQRRRQQERVFDTKQAFVTLRDLFRWGTREADDYRSLAINGYVLIAERTRKVQDKKVVKDVIEQVMRVTIDERNLYNIFDESATSRLLGAELAASLSAKLQSTEIVWTRAMQRLVCLVACCLRYNEPVLLVGETGTGKTSVCEILARLFECQLASVNCHQNTDAADLLGGQRPLRSRAARREAARAKGMQLLLQHGIDSNVSPVILEDVAAQLSSLEIGSKDENVRHQARSARVQINQSLALFEWHDGPLVTAMRQGQHVLLDEISLADDSVLERLNSVLEPSRTLVLAERASSKLQSDHVMVRAKDGFQIVATMNPGGDYGKKELSPALRNRFTEIWVPAVDDQDDIVAIIDSQWTTDRTRTAGFAHKMITFVRQLDTYLGASGDGNIGLRDYIAWARFVDGSVTKGVSALTPEDAYVHGALMTIIDGLPIHPFVAAKPLRQIQELLSAMTDQVTASVGTTKESIEATQTTLHNYPGRFSIGEFSISKGTSMAAYDASAFDMSAKTPAKNAMRVLRAMQVNSRAIMLEGSPGAGKTSLIVALARASRHPLTRINLSDQTELSDLFGSDLPIEDGKPGEFGWRDAAFLQAMQRGEWVLLDEMNLASQSVLEGLNSCLDHRGTVYVPELGRSFSKHVNFRFFAAQNPQHQGGGRKGLPKSFLNRFTKVYVEELNADDFRAILSAQSSTFSAEQLDRIVSFNERLQTLLRDSNSLSKAGQPWEFNLRDLLRWTQLSSKELGFVQPDNKGDPLQYFDTIYLQRFRSESDRLIVANLAAEVFERPVDTDSRPWLSVTPSYTQVGQVRLPRGVSSNAHLRDAHVSHGIAPTHLGTAAALGVCIRLGLPAILIGHANDGKTALLRKMALLRGATLHEVRMSSGTDTVDLIGGFEQEDRQSHADSLLDALDVLLTRCEETAIIHDTQGATLPAVLALKRVVAAQRLKFSLSALVEHVSSLLSLDTLTQSERSAAQKLLDDLYARSQNDSSSQASQARFVWRDGPIVSALRRGHWIVLDDANLCSASVLDRLNSLLEPGGSMVFSERGVIPTSSGAEIETVYPHPDFRIFFSMDSKYGELSRAMRNRGIELYLSARNGEDDVSSGRRAWHSSEASMQSLMPSLELCQTSTADELEAELTTELLLRTGNSTTMAVTSRLVSENKLKELHVGWHSVGKYDSNVLQGSPFDVEDLVLQPFDLQINPQLYIRDVDAWQSLMSRVMRIAGRAAHFCARLDLIAKTIDGSKMAELSVLQRSALCASDVEMDMPEREARHGYAFAQQVVYTLLQTAQTFMAGKAVVNGQSLRALEMMQDCTVYLLQIWASSTRNNLDVSRLTLSKIRKSLDLLEEQMVIATDSSLTRLLQTMSNPLELCCGHAMAALWRAYLPRSSSLQSVALSKKIMNLATTYRNVASPELLSHSTELIAMLQYYDTAGSSEEQAQSLELGGKLIEAYECLPEADQSGVDGADVQYHCSDAIICAALVLATQLDTRKNIARTATLLDGSQNATLLQTSVSLKALSFTKRDTLQLSYGSSAWIASASASQIVSGEDSVGSHNLFLPFLTRALVDLCMPSARLPLSQWRERQTALDRMGKLVVTLSNANSVDRETQCFDLLTSLLHAYRVHLRAALSDTNEESNPAYVVLLNAVDSATDLGLAEALRAIRQSDDASSAARSVAESWEQMIVLASLKSTHDQSMFQKGSRMLRFSRQLLHLYVTNIPVDPLAAARTQHDFLSFQCRREREARKLAAGIEESVSGTAKSDYITELDGRVEELERSASQMPASTAIAIDRATTDSSHLYQLHAEMSTFVEQLLSFDMVERLIKTKHDGGSISRIDNMQKTIVSVVSRFGVRYAGLQDLTEPFMNGLLLANVALGMLRQACVLSSRSSSTSHLNDLAEALTVFPTAASTMALDRSLVPAQVPDLVMPILLVKLKALLRERKDGLPVRSIFASVATIYQHIWQLWTSDEERRKQQKEEESSLYRTRNLDISVEEDGVLLEKEFAQLFPQHEDVMEEIANAEPMTNHVVIEKGTSFLSGERSVQLFHLQMALFGNDDDDGKSGISYANQRRDIVRYLLNRHYKQFSEALDIGSAAFQLELLASAAEHNRGGEDDDEADFYRDGNPAEAVKLQALVQGVEARLLELISAFPDQHVLQDLRKRCEMLLRLDLNSSVNRLLSALEGLLDHTEDWQVYASSKTSLQAQRDTMTALIIEWRRMELNSWRTLLCREDVRAHDEAHTLWLTLYQLCVKSSYSSAEDEREVVKLLDQFLRASNLGQFDARLKLLRSIVSYLRNDESADQQNRVKSIVSNTVAFFAQFSSAVREYKLKKRRLVESEINDFVKLASWKDTNVHALKTSAQKTHRKLHQCIRKYRTVLSERIDAVLVALVVDGGADKLQIPCIEGEVMSFAISPLIGEDKQEWHESQTPQHLVNLKMTALTLSRMLERQIQPGLADVSFAEGIEDLSVAIDERSKELAKATPAFLTDKNVKLVKSLEQRKRKAWSDLLKELRRIGLNRSQIDGLNASQMQDTAFVFGLDVPPASIVATSVDPLHRLLSKMPVLRGTISSRERNEDVDVAQLQSALGYVESGMAFAVALRQRLSNVVERRKSVAASLHRLECLLSSENVHVATGETATLRETLLTYELYWTRLTSSLNECKARIDGLRSGEGASSHAESMERHIANVGSVRSSLAQMNKTFVEVDSTIITAEERDCLADAESVLDDVVDYLRKIITDVPSWHSYTIPLLAFIVQNEPIDVIEFVDSNVASPAHGQASDTLISSILVVAQDVRTICTSLSKDNDADELIDHAVTKEAKVVASLHHALRLDDVCTAVRPILRAASARLVSSALQRVQPFLQGYERMLGLLCRRTVKCYNAQMKLNMTLCALLTTLASRGFCKPRQEETDQGDADDAQDGEQLEGGVGLGEGQGAKDVTDTLQDDEEMEELQKDQDDGGEPDESETKREKDAREMEQDFDGKVEDIEEEDGQDGEEEKQDGEEDEIDDAVGDVDPLDINAVDEKTWNGQDGEEDKNKEKDEKEMDGDENAGQQDGGERQTGKETEETEGNAEGAGERNDEERQSKDEKGTEQDVEGGADEPQDAEHDGDEEAEGEDDEPQTDGLGRAIDQQANVEENLDLNLDEQMDMDGDGEDSDMADFQSVSDGQEADKEREASVGDEDIEFDEPAPEDTEDSGGHQDAKEDAEGDVEGDEQAQLPREPGEEGVEEEDQAAEQDNDNIEGHDGTAIDSAAAQEGGSDAQDAAEIGDAAQDITAEQQQASRAQKGRQARGEESVVQEQSLEDQPSESIVDDQEQKQGASNGGQGEGDQGDEVGEEPSDESAPTRSFGDALKDFRKNLDAIQERLSQQESKEGTGPLADEESKAVEHIADDEQSDMQALGAAQEEDALKQGEDLTAAAIVDDQMEQDDTRVAHDEESAMDEPQKSFEQRREEHVNDDQPSKSGGRGMMASDVRTDQQDDLMDGVEGEREDEEELTIDQIDEDLVMTMHAALEDASDEEERLDVARQLWRLYNTATTEYAFALSEQLRLILTPTKATKLTGDFKTGKRLNMRKIIPFIASDYVKDKIWLRRHLPQKREYQVLICMDDSKSMSESHNKTLAFKSLALVCSALDRLEVGEVGVMKFGRTAELLKGFAAGGGGGGESVGDAQGAQIFSRLPFDQRGTNVLQLLQQSYDVLTDARADRSSTATGQELWQLQIIISDGICQDHEGLRAMLRRAAEAHIMVVFVILDSLQQPQSDAAAAAAKSTSSSNSSILTMSSVEYKADANGRMQLQMKRYLDTFPFEYFVVVQDAADLPDVLSATLRQWAQRIAEM